jgi:hypothetical protein
VWIRTLDTKAALAIPGIHAVITAAEIGRGVPRIPAVSLTRRKTRLPQPIARADTAIPFSLFVRDTGLEGFVPATRKTREQVKSSIWLTVGVSTLSPVPTS